MFHCEAGHITKPGEKMHRYPIETRSITYPERIDRLGTRYAFGVGTAIVREAQLCSAHVAELQSLEAERS